MDEDRDKNPVIALREIAEETISPETMEERLITGLQRHVELDEPEDDELATQMISHLYADNVDPDAEAPESTSAEAQG